MKRTKIKSLFTLFMIAFTLSAVAFADIPETSSGTGSPLVYKLSDVGGVNGGGGGTPCAEFTDLFTTFGESLQQSVINETFKVSNQVETIDALLAVTEGIRCLPAERLDRDARSNYLTKITRLNIMTWKEKNINEKLRLIAHEFCVMLALENEGEYQTSEKLLRTLLQVSPLLRSTQRSEKAVANADGSITFLKPFILDEKNIARPVYIESAKDKRATSLCKLFEMHQALEVWTAPTEGVVAVMDNRGAGALSVIRDMSDMNRSPLKIESVTCK